MAAIYQFIRKQIIGNAPPIAMSIKHTFEGSGVIRSIIFLQDNVHMMSGSDDGAICKWDCETGELVGEAWKGVYQIRALALSPDGKIIACGRTNGSVERWDTNGKMVGDVWAGHSDIVGSLSWSPSGAHLASGSEDGTVLIRELESGETKIGAIKTHRGRVWSVAYSPLGDRIASSGDNGICILDSDTGELLVGPIKDLGGTVNTIIWSGDNAKLYTSSGVLDSASGLRLHHFGHYWSQRSIALSPKHNLLARVGWGGTAQLWDTVSHRPFSNQFAPKIPDSLIPDNLHCVSSSPDGRYLAYGGLMRKITLWAIEDIATDLPVPTNITQPTTLPKLQSSSLLNVEVTDLLGQSAVNDGQGRDNPYNESFMPHSSPPLLPPNPSPAHHFWHIFLAHHLPTNEFMRHMTLGVFQRRATLHTDSEQHDLTPIGKSKAANQVEEHDHINSSEDVAPGTTKRGNDKGKQRAHSPLHQSQSQSPHPPSTARRIWAMIGSSQHRPPSTEPEPRTIYAARPKKFYWKAPRRANKQETTKVNANENAGGDTVTHANVDADTSANANNIAHSQTDQTPSAGARLSIVQPELGMSSSQIQAAVQSPHEHYDFGCWGNFWHSLQCIPRPVAS